MLAFKKDALKEVEETIHNYQDLFEKSGDPIFKQAIDDNKLEYEMIKAIPDDDNFMLTYADLLLKSGLTSSAERRFEDVSKKATS